MWKTYGRNSGCRIAARIDRSLALDSRGLVPMGADQPSQPASQSDWFRMLVEGEKVGPDLFGKTGPSAAADFGPGNQRTCSAISFASNV